ncbi:MAG: hypothetical protein A2666_00505 [Parcubacteria group bacterium RIFCSPHIGHO2_01_FULL_47_10b]|nr:MAG: hypothetical protein A2666_00505 [Parcubacteria group bacterium RIFCSPHIGHO2_01_FULL_47_10b]
MKQFILLQSYIGSSDFTYEVTCTGRILGLDEAHERGFTNRETMKRHARSSYTAAWYEIKAHDQIEVELRNDEGDEHAVFIVPEAGLPNPPVSLDDERTGPRIHEYLKEHCECAE